MHKYFQGFSFTKAGLLQITNSVNIIGPFLRDDVSAN